MDDKAPAHEDRANPRATPEYRAAFARFLRGGVGVLAGEELRALQAGTDPKGGYLIAPQQFLLELIKAVDDQVVIRGLSLRRIYCCCRHGHVIAALPHLPRTY